jgi:hypothetical protein
VLAHVVLRAPLLSTPQLAQHDGAHARHHRRQEYTAHFDYFFDKKNQDAAEGGQRVVTALMYLSTPEEGGETVFPDAENETPPGQALSACAARGGLANKPTKGDMLMFYSLTPDGEVDPKSLHASCPTLKGEKWSATKWIHVGGFRVGAGARLFCFVLGGGGSAKPRKQPNPTSVGRSKHCRPRPLTSCRKKKTQTSSAPSGPAAASIKVSIALLGRRRASAKRMRAICARRAASRAGCAAATLQQRRRLPLN